MVCDNASAAAKCKHLRQWWDQLSDLSPKYGYVPNGVKSYLIVKEGHMEEAKQAFVGTNIPITTSGARYLGAALRLVEFKEEYVRLMVS